MDSFWKPTARRLRSRSGHGRDFTRSAWTLSRQEAIRRAVEDRWMLYWPAYQRGGQPSVVASRSARVKAYSVLFEYTLTFPSISPPIVLFAKIRRQPGRDDAVHPGVTPNEVALGLAEWEGLTRAYRYFAARREGLGVVRPVDYLEPYHVILVEKASGRDLGKLVKAADPAVPAALARAGHWLATFHGGVHQGARGEWTWLGYAARLHARRSRLLRRDVSPGVLDPLLERVRDQARRLSPVIVPRSMLHGDYKLKHIWATPQAIEVLDFGNLREGDCYADVAALLVEVLSVRLGRPWVSRERIGGYAQTFLQAYFSTDPPRVFWLYVIDSLLKKWSRRLQRWSGGNSTLWAVSLQQCARLVRGTEPLNQIYVSQWFTRRIGEALDLARRAKP